MEISVAALSFLILAAAFGSQARVIHDTLEEILRTEHQLETPVISEGFHVPADCCFSYTSQRIRCSFIRDYFLTSSGCPQPGVIFLTKRGKHVCANPHDLRVQRCMTDLSLASMTNDLGIIRLDGREGV
ncbi:C-C motif chemokine 15 [Castor canadensis]|uniref:C-C motif chemokine n=1 Tax=Castor canadensis TaxID=51338 RepID=A0A8C0XR71_CASCN|nr:C-C motif chemokine 15-like [Castor canadensis]